MMVWNKVRGEGIPVGNVTGSVLFQMLTRTKLGVEEVGFGLGAEEVSRGLPRFWPVGQDRWW